MIVCCPAQFPYINYRSAAALLKITLKGLSLALKKDDRIGASIFLAGDAWSMAFIGAAPVLLRADVSDSTQTQEGTSLAAGDAPSFGLPGNKFTFSEFPPNPHWLC